MKDPAEKDLAVEKEQTESLIQQRLEKEHLLEDKASAAGRILQQQLVDRIGGSLQNVQPVMLVSAVFDLAVNSRATDIHFDPRIRASSPASALTACFTTCCKFPSPSNRTLSRA